MVYTIRRVAGCTTLHTYIGAHDSMGIVAVLESILIGVGGFALGRWLAQQVISKLKRDAARKSVPVPTGHYTNNDDNIGFTK